MDQQQPPEPREVPQPERLVHFLDDNPSNSTAQHQLLERHWQNESSRHGTGSNDHSPVFVDDDTPPPPPQPPSHAIPSKCLLMKCLHTYEPPLNLLQIAPAAACADAP